MQQSSPFARLISKLKGNEKANVSLCSGIFQDKDLTKNARNKTVKMKSPYPSLPPIIARHPYFMISSHYDSIKIVVQMI